MSCSPFDLRDYLLEELAAGDRREVEKHVRACAGCREELDRLRLTQALRFHKAEDLDKPPAERKPLDIPAAENIGLPANDLLARAEPVGGTFTELMVPYLVSRKVEKLDDEPKAR